MYRYKDNQPKRREIDGPFKGTVWIPGALYAVVPEDKIGVWFEKEESVGATGGSPYGIDNEENEIETTIKKNSEGEAPGPDLDDQDEIKI